MKGDCPASCRGAVMIIVYSIIIIVLSCLLLAYPIYILMRESDDVNLRSVGLLGIVTSLPAAGSWLLLHAAIQDPLSQVIISVWPLMLVLPGIIASGCFVCLLKRAGVLGASA
jgi:hypothetical protein